MKERIKEVIATLQGVESDVRPGSSGEVAFRQALIELIKIEEAPAPEPERIIETIVATEALALGVVDKIHALFTPIVDRLNAIDGRLDGFEDHMAALMTPTPAPETAPA